MPVPPLPQPLILWGATGQARVLAEFLPAQGWNIVALFDNNPEVFSPLPEVALAGNESTFRDWLSQQPNPPAALVAIGGSHGQVRLRLQRWLQALGCTFPIAIHPAAYVAHKVTVGLGTQILAGAIVSVDAQLGEAVIINTRASIDHECQLKDGVHIGPGATLCGLVHVDSGAFIGAGATLLPRVRIGRDTVVGAGAVVTHDLPDNVIAYGNPARMIRPRVTTHSNESA